jgi:CheY-like chemotaxis protein
MSNLLFTDVVMPHMSGKELSDRFRLLYPRTKLLFTTAYAENAIVHQGVLAPARPCCKNPSHPAPWPSNSAKCSTKPTNEPRPGSASRPRLFGFSRIGAGDLM